MKANDIMIRDVFYVKGTDPIRVVIQNFIKHGISGVPVVNDQKELIAYISDGDIMRYIGRHKDIVVDSLYFVNVVEGDREGFSERVKQILTLPALDIAKKKVIKVSWDEEVENVATILGKRKIKKVPVERDGKLVGVISRGDVIRHTFKGLL
ncbi:CBS domain-containing protein [Lederbergia sp. NSJ-179]|uniref:CBS domain-containing protein n=1 Tax=Lederbergia sp. NSJ-179 TaxID=2931402 RepID=UPI001FD04C0A|nr:CBS domain-containing protein [Lederbergia sp. NSJ-179]MCJ7842468.1 CBS domain-containing protein [Lederbergia sp. NSJ-179]